MNFISLVRRALDRLFHSSAAVLATILLGCSADELTKPTLVMPQIPTNPSVTSPRAGLAPVDISEGTVSIAYGINDAGMVVGQSNGVAVRFSPIAPLFNPSGGTPIVPFGVSAQGYVAGGGTPPGGGDAAFVTDPGRVVWLASLPSASPYATAFDVNDQGHVVGRSFSGSVFQATFWNSADVAINYGTPGLPSTAWGINNSDVVVGQSRAADNVYYATKWLGAGSPVLLPMPPGFAQGEARGITNSEYVVGFAYAAGFASAHALFWNPDGTLTDLHPFCEAALGSVVPFSNALGVSETIHGEVLVAGTCGDAAIVWFRFPSGAIATQVLPPLPGRTGAVANAVNAHGDVVGASHGGGNFYRATQWGVTVPNLPPTVSLTLPSGVVEGSSAQLNSSAQDPNDPNTPITFDWDFGDGSPHANGCCPSHTWADNGSYTVTVTASDGTLSTSATGTLVVTNVAPTATLVAPSGDVTTGTTFSLSLTNPQDPGTDDVVAGFFYSFDCGDGVLAPAPGSTVTCTAPAAAGQITVRGKVLDKDSDGTTYSATVDITPVPNQPPVVQPLAPVSGDEGSAVQFTSVANDPESQPLTYDWDFGDGTPHGTGATPSHTYEDSGPGSYTVTLVVSDGSLATTVTTTASIANVAPTATLTATGPVTVGVPFAVTMSNPTDPSPIDAASLEFAFDCEGDGTFAAYSPTATTNCTRNSVGAGTVGGRVRDRKGAVSAYSAPVTVQPPPNQPPVLQPMTPVAGQEGTPVAFGASASDPESQPLSYTWDFGDGSPAGIGATPTHTYADNGVYTVTVVVSDGDLTATTSTSVTVTNVAPTASLVAPGGNVTAGFPFTLSLTNLADVSPVDLAAGFQYQFDCGSGVLQPSAGATTTCTAPVTTGATTVRGKLIDKDGGNTLYTASVNIVSNTPPTLTLTGPYTGQEGAGVAMQANASDPEAQPLAYDWDFGDGSPHGTGPTPSHAYPDNGSYTITVQVTDGVNTATATTTATLSNRPPSGTPVAPTTPVNQGTPFTISIVGATDPSPVDAASLQFRFSCGGAFGPFQTSPNFTCTQTSPGTYTVQMRIRDKDGGVVTYSSSVTIANVAPTVSISGPATVHVPVGGTLNLSGSFTDPGPTDNPWQARIAWGAGQGQKNFASVTPGTPITGSHVYATAGTYSLKLYVQDKFGAIGQKAITVIVP